jgi:hypothetical protein
MEEFIFEEHVTKFDYSPIIEKLEKRLEKTWFKWKKESLKYKIWLRKEQKKGTDNGYEYLSELFSEIKKQNICKIGYRVFPDDNMKLFAEGQGIEKVDLNGKLVFEKDENERITKIPVTIGKIDDCYITIYDQPQIELPMFGKLTLSYKFKAEVYAFIQYKETKDPEQTLKFNLSSGEPLKYCFYKKDGKICYRIGDGLDNALRQDMFGHNNDNDEKIMGPEFTMYGQIHAGETLFYQGNFECDSYWFPYCIKPDNDSRNKEKSPVPKQPEAVKV